jgi:hypothetical protein
MLAHGAGDAGVERREQQGDGRISTDDNDHDNDHDHVPPWERSPRA